METFGIELEVSDLGISEAQTLINRAGLRWQVKMDGTRHVSAEAVSPILTADSLNEVKKATRALLIGGATVNRQTGYHVHLGADEYGTEVACPSLEHEPYIARLSRKALDFGTPTCPCGLNMVSEVR